MCGHSVAVPVIRSPSLPRKMTLHSTLAPYARRVFAATDLRVLATLAGCARPITRTESDVHGDIAVARRARSGRGTGEAGRVDSLIAIRPIVPNRWRERPIVTPVGANASTEATEYMVPFGVLSECGAADVKVLRTEAGPPSSFPPLTIDPEATVAEFNRSAPDGADVVIVPALHDPDDPELVRWIREQAEKGALVVGICGEVCARDYAGSPNGREAVGQWYSRDRLLKRFANTLQIRDPRFVADADRVMTTDGAASIPVFVTLVEASGGAARTDSLVGRRGSSSWCASHEGDRFGLDAGHFWAAVSNWRAFRQKETIGLGPVDGVHDFPLAADLRCIAEIRIGVDRLFPARDTAQVLTLEKTLTESGDRYGARTRAFVDIQIEYAPTTSGADR